LKEINANQVKMPPVDPRDLRICRTWGWSKCKTTLRCLLTPVSRRYLVDETSSPKGTIEGDARVSILGPLSAKRIDHKAAEWKAATEAEALTVSRTLCNGLLTFRRHKKKSGQTTLSAVLFGRRYAMRPMPADSRTGVVACRGGPADSPSSCLSYGAINPACHAKLPGDPRTYSSN
jgi:hypothetical protein